MNLKLIALRKASSEDELFLLRVYASTRADEMARVDWSPLQKDMFLQMQFRAQRQYYQAQFPAADHHIILWDQTPVGRIMVLRTPEEFHLIDIAILPDYRRQGIGGELLRSLQTEASQAGLPIRLHVEISNPALRLYERLGFIRTGLEGIYYSMAWRPSTAVPEPAHSSQGSVES